MQSIREIHPNFCPVQSLGCQSRRFDRDMRKPGEGAQRRDDLAARGLHPVGSQRAGARDSGSSRSGANSTPGTILANRYFPALP
jgi:hypothetical protein